MTQSTPAPELESSIAARLRWASQDGCPVAPRTAEQALAMAAIARRRWNSFNRRSPNQSDDMDARIEDLARGIAEKFERGGWPMVGPLISDYRWLTQQIVPILTQAPE